MHVAAANNNNNNNKPELSRTASAGSPTSTSKEFVSSDIDSVSPVPVYSNYKILGKNKHSLMRSMCDNCV